MTAAHDDTNDSLLMDVRSEADNAKKRDVVSAQLATRIHRLDGFSGYDMSELLSGLLGEVEAKLTPADALHLLRRLRDLIADHADSISNLLKDSVDGVPGNYGDFTIVLSASPAKVDAAELERLHPDVYAKFSVPAVDAKRLKTALPEVYEEVSRQGADRVSVRT